MRGRRPQRIEHAEGGVDGCSGQGCHGPCFAAGEPRPPPPARWATSPVNRGGSRSRQCRRRGSSPTKRLRGRRGFGVGRLPRQASRHGDDQPSRRGFGWPEDAQHREVEASRQGGAAAGGQPGHGNERGQDALQRHPVHLDCPAAVHCFAPRSKAGPIVREVFGAGMEIDMKIFLCDGNQWVGCSISKIPSTPLLQPAARIRPPPEGAFQYVVRRSSEGGRPNWSR
jgi:hypothetical protein